MTLFSIATCFLLWSYGFYSEYPPNGANNSRADEGVFMHLSAKLRVYLQYISTATVARPPSLSLQGFCDGHLSVMRSTPPQNISQFSLSNFAKSLVRHNSRLNSIRNLFTTTVGSKLLYLGAFGESMVSINDVKIAQDLLDKRSALYSSR